jgi:hypothetical protein
MSRVFQGLPAERPFYSSEIRGWPLDRHQRGWMVAIGQWLDGPVLAPAGDVETAVGWFSPRSAMNSEFFDLF